MKILAVAMNYAEHNKELGGTLYEGRGSEPAIFAKTDSALLTGGRPFFIPAFTRQCEYEAEVVVRIRHLGRSIPLRWASRYYDAVTVGIDFTARDLQARLRREGLPWEISKSFDGSAAVGRLVPVQEAGDLRSLHFRLDVNGRTVQEGCTADMLFSVDEIVAHASRYFTLKTGDLIFTGTPAGTGPVKENDHLEGFLEGQKVLEFNAK